MAVKSIKLRGITRNPSDRMMEEGGVAESLNVYLDNTENKPMAYPKEVTDAKLPSNWDYRVILIHKTGSGDMYICLVKESTYSFIGKFHTPVDDEDDGKEEILVLGNETFKSISAVGNILIVNTDTSVHYLLFTGSYYKNLGSRIPLPEIQPDYVMLDMLEGKDYVDPSKTYDPFYVGKKSNNDEEHEFSFGGEHSSMTLYGEEITKNGDKTYYNQDDTSHVLDYAMGSAWSGANYRMLDKIGDAMLNKTWEAVNKLRDNNHRYGILNSPVFLTVALRLYDGSVYAPSSPFAMGMYNDSQTRHNNLFSVEINTELYTSGDTKNVRAYAKIDMDYAYKIHLIYGNLYNQYQDWKDIIEGIDIFITDPTRLEKDYLKLKTLTNAEVFDTTSYHVHKYTMELDPDSVDLHKEERLVSNMVMHKVLSYDYSEFQRISNTQEDVNEDMRSDNLDVKETLSAVYSTNHVISGSGSMVYNDRLVQFNVEKTLTGGYHALNGAMIEIQPSATTWKEYKYLFEIKTLQNGLLYTEGSTISCKVAGTSNTFHTPYGFISYPDSRCSAVFVGVRDHVDSQANNVGWTWKRIPMKEIPSIDSAYCFAGFNTKIENHQNAMTAALPVIKNKDVCTGYLYQSESGNPFMFSDENSVKVCGSGIIDVATITTALSQGQFGSYGLYAFTEEGIWAMGINDEGAIISSVPLSRDVAVSKETVTPIDQAVIFLTKAGLKMLSGSEIKDLSLYMNGPQWKLTDTNEKTILTSKGFGEFKNTLEDDDWLMKFLEGSGCAYDYTGGRLIFINDDYDYQYVYMIASQSWHKVQMPYAGNYTFGSPVNSYPECFTNYQWPVGEGEFRQMRSGLLDWTTSLEDSYKVDEEDGEIKGVIVTRPISLDNDDVLKTISAIKIRGHYSRYDADGKPRVLYILEGSQDGVNFHRLGSLRGKAWKMYRVIVMFKLTSIESLSWIDIEYDTKFTDRLR